MFGKEPMQNLQTKQPTPTISKCVPDGFVFVEEQEGWSILDEDSEVVLQARHYEDLRDRVCDILKTRNELVEDSLADLITRFKADS